MHSIRSWGHRFDVRTPSRHDKFPECGIVNALATDQFSGDFFLTEAMFFFAISALAFFVRIHSAQSAI
jgi:hypothetical protein